MNIKEPPVVFCGGNETSEITRSIIALTKRIDAAHHKVVSVCNYLTILMTLCGIFTFTAASVTLYWSVKIIQAQMFTAKVLSTTEQRLEGHTEAVRTDTGAHSTSSSGLTE